MQTEGSRLCAARAGKRAEAEAALQAQRYQHIGPRKVEVDWLKKKLEWPTEAQRGLSEPAHPRSSMARECQRVGRPRASWDDPPTGVRRENLQRMRWLDEPYTRTPLYGVRRRTAWVRSQGQAVYATRVARLRRVMGLEAISPQPHTRQRALGPRVYPYVLRGLSLRRVKHGWSTDLTSIRLRSGCIYGVAVRDGFSRYVRSWAVSMTREGGLWVEALARALVEAQPASVHSEQGAQLTSLDCTRRLQAAGMQSSMDGRGRARDHSCVERLWRSVTEEEVDVHEYETPQAAVIGLRQSFDVDKHQRLQQALDDQTPATVYVGG